jgi:teichuronic acid biosynthesis glycosyltransferase TuaG
MYSSELVSIIMPAYNAENTIVESIESVLRQSYPNFELLVCDDHSTDDTLSLINTYSKKDSRIVSVNNVFGKGAPGARNSCIDRASGRFIFFLDSDDTWHRQKIELQITFMRERNASFSYTYYKTKSNGKVIEAPNNCGLDVVKFSNPIGCLTVCYDSKKVGPIFQPSYPTRNDYALWLEIFKRDIIGICLPVVLATYNDTTQGISSNYKRNAKIHIKILREILGMSNSRSHFYFLIYCAITWFKKINVNIYNSFIRLV